jgi:hypothetical protein
LKNKKTKQKNKAKALERWENPGFCNDGDGSEELGLRSKT